MTDGQPLSLVCSPFPSMSQRRGTAASNFTLHRSGSSRCSPRPVSVAFGASRARLCWRSRIGEDGISGRAILSSMNTDLLAEALKLSPGDRLQLIEALWDTLSEGDIPVTPEERTLLDERLADLEQNPDAQSPWSEVKARLEQRHP